MAELTNFNVPVQKTGEGGFPDPYFAPYNQNMQFQQMNQYPLHTLPTGQPSAIRGPPNSEVQVQASVGPLTSKVARDKRKQVRQKSKSVAPTAPSIPTKGTAKEKPVSGRGSDGKLTAKKDKTITIFCTPDGKVTGPSSLISRFSEITIRYILNLAFLRVCLSKKIKRWWIILIVFILETIIKVL